MVAKLKTLVTQLCPPVLLPAVRAAYRALAGGKRSAALTLHPHSQDLDVYWDPEMERILETWGEGNVWDEIQLLLAGRRGRVLDIACGTGKTMQILAAHPGLELHGCDISDKLLERAVARGLLRERLHVGDATRLPYPDDHFDYAYSIGSLEHFTEEGIGRLLAECHRVTRYIAFHQHPISRSGSDEGWIKTMQSYFNNGVDWWLPRYRAVYADVRVLPSRWEDTRSFGRWFVCVKRDLER
jgi:ubiquinone/menaquinone biosynthesis C-methylase UbiE